MYAPVIPKIAAITEPLPKQDDKFKMATTIWTCYFNHKKKFKMAANIWPWYFNNKNKLKILAIIGPYYFGHKQKNQNGRKYRTICFFNYNNKCKLTAISGTLSKTTNSKITTIKNILSIKYNYKFKLAVITDPCYLKYNNEFNVSKFIMAQFQRVIKQGNNFCLAK